MKIKDFVITSRANPLVNETVKLQKKRYRYETGRFLIDGRKLSYEYIKSCGVPCFTFVNEADKDDILAELSELEKTVGVELTVTLVSEGVFTKLTEQSSPDGIILVGDKGALSYSENLTEIGSGERIIILDSLQDPGNVGTLIRSALAFGFDRVIMSRDSVDLFNSKTLRASMGAMFSIKLTVANDLIDSVKFLLSEGRRVYAAELRDRSVSLDSVPIAASDVFVIGNEGHGIRDQVSEMCTSSVFIPISEKSESLNAAIAGSVLMWHQHNFFD